MQYREPIIVANKADVQRRRCQGPSRGCEDAAPNAPQRGPDASQRIHPAADHLASRSHWCRAGLATGIQLVPAAKRTP